MGDGVGGWGEGVRGEGVIVAGGIVRLLGLFFRIGRIWNIRTLLQGYISTSL